MSLSFHVKLLTKKLLTVFLVTLLLAACGRGSNTTSDDSPTTKQTAIQLIMAYAGDGSKPAPTLQDYLDAGVSGVSNENLAALNTVVDGLDPMMLIQPQN